MRELEKWLARVLLLNSGLALAVSLGLLGETLAGAARWGVFGAALLGFLSAVACLKRRVVGLYGAGGYYFLQLFSYFPINADWYIAVKAGVSVGLVLRFPAGVLVLNTVALALFGLTLFVLARRVRSA